MFSEVDMWFYKYLAGIQIVEGAKAVCIQPCFLEEVKWVRAKHRGVSVYWDENVLNITSDLPVILKIRGQVAYLEEGSYSVDRRDCI